MEWYCSMTVIVQAWILGFIYQRPQAMRRVAHFSASWLKLLSCGDAQVAIR
jgi:hypothetical protein